MNNRWPETKKRSRLGKKGAQNHYGNGRAQSAPAGWVLPLNERKPLDHTKMISFKRPKRAVWVSRRFRKMIAEPTNCPHEFLVWIDQLSAWKNRSVLEKAKKVFEVFWFEFILKIISAGHHGWMAWINCLAKARSNWKDLFTQEQNWNAFHQKEPERIKGQSL